MPFDLEERFIIEAESAIGARLPEAYRQYMMTQNGGNVVVNDDDWDLHPIPDKSDRKRLSRTANNILSETKVCRDLEDFPEGAIAIASNGMGDRLVLLHKDGIFREQVYLWSHGDGELTEVEEDLASILRPAEE